ncbi:MAG: NUDIX domain-containing protein [Planctomycetota bacterium]
MSEFCSYCGAEHTATGWPRTCSGCQWVTYRNPTPVAVLLQPVEPGGLLVIRRGIEPRRGFLALPGGYVDWQEPWQAAAARELREETGVAAEPGAIRAFDVQSPPDGRTVLIFGLAPALPADALPAFRPTNETTERALIAAPEEMAFPLHTAAVARWFGGWRGLS